MRSFSLLLVKVGLEAALVRCECVRQTVRRLPQVPGAPSISISLEMAAYPVHGRTEEELTSDADAALYAAKNKGRDRLQIAACSPDSQNLQREMRSLSGASLVS